MRLYINFFFLIFSLCIYSQEENNIDSIIENIEKAQEKEKKAVSRKESKNKTLTNRAILPANSAQYKYIFFGITGIQGDQKSPTDIDRKYEIGYFDGNSNYFGFQFGVQGSNTIYQPSSIGSYNDSVWNLLYGMPLTNDGSILDAVFLTLAIGYHSYNYDTIDSFGPFYDIGDDFYYALGAKIFLIKFGGFQALFEYNIDYNGNRTSGFGLSLSL